MILGNGRSPDLKGYVMSEEETGELCDRCGEAGEDRRTLWHACFYEMAELGLPFVKQHLFKASNDDLEAARAPVVFDAGPNGAKLTIAGGTVKCHGELRPMSVYTLRVCKLCRSDWMTAIKGWFERPSSRRSVGSGIWVRKNGATVEVTREEWERLHQGEPLTVRGNDR